MTSDFAKQSIKHLLKFKVHCNLLAIRERHLVGQLLSCGSSSTQTQQNRPRTKMISENNLCWQIFWLITHIRSKLRIGKKFKYDLIWSNRTIFCSYLMLNSNVWEALLTVLLHQIHHLLQKLKDVLLPKHKNFPRELYCYPQTDPITNWPNKRLIW